MNLYYKGNEVSISGGGDRPLAGKRIIALGDSNTQYMGDHLAEKVIEYTGAKSLRNNGRAGATWGVASGDATTTDNSSAVGAVNSLINPYITAGKATEYDIITLMFGTNGDVKDGQSNYGTKDSTDVSTTWGAMKYCFDKLLYYYRDATIAVFLPIQRAGGVMTESIAVIKECCELYSIPYYDMSGQGQIPSDTKMPISIAEQGLANNGYGQIYFGDNVHLNSVGQAQYYHKYARFLESIV